MNEMTPISQMRGLTDGQRQQLIALAGDFRGTPAPFEALLRVARLMAERDRLLAEGKGPETLPPRWADVPVPKREAA